MCRVSPPCSAGLMRTTAGNDGDAEPAPVARRPPGPLRHTARTPDSRPVSRPDPELGKSLCGARTRARARHRPEKPGFPYRRPGAAAVSEFTTPRRRAAISPPR
jgi:hypothetical protein